MTLLLLPFQLESMAGLLNGWKLAEPLFGLKSSSCVLPSTTYGYSTPFSLMNFVRFLEHSNTPLLVHHDHPLAACQLHHPTPTITLHPSKIKHRACIPTALEYEELITEIRELEGFQKFLRPKTLPQLVAACTSGPVVLINVHTTRCGALVLCRASDVVHIPLPNFSLVDAKAMQDQLWDLGGGRVTAMDPPDMMRKILADLWNQLVKPIMDVVLTLVPPSTTLPHITWCPTGPLAFLPFHAAGIYPKHESTNAHSQTIIDIAVSSYTPTLEALLKPRTKVTAGDTEYPMALVLSQPATPNCDRILNMRTEA
ncbi:hypothetical protein BDY19DRAFT_1061084 [Irpex rosettiformis]|uniref:Uncharacterized protein n=1 Tax=Irpex rosettiformis TaxID=378272 RepID=A0ACB8TME7_9APHY|nr:hypothetical protein BDY19DRAFT_1061084 [Irpex rosettiformis]